MGAQGAPGWRLAGRLVAAGLAVAAAAGIRAGAVRRLPPDFDELVYLPAAFRYAECMEPGRWGRIPAIRANPEHPALVKLAFAADLRCRRPAEPDWASLKVGRPMPEAAWPAFAGARTLSAVAGVLQVALLALISPWGAPWLALDTYHAKYSAQAYLEALPGLLALVSVLLAERALRGRGTAPAARSLPSPGLLAASGAALGLAAAGKLPYALVAGCALAPFLVLATRSRPRLLALFLGAGLGAFLAGDPALWSGPVERLREAIAFHLRYPSAAHVRRSALPWWQQLSYLTTAAPARWHPGIFPTTVADRTLLLAAAAGAPFAARHRPIWLAWALVGLAFLLAWPVRWPQYTLLVRPALAVCAGCGLAALAGAAARRGPW